MLVEKSRVGSGWCYMRGPGSLGHVQTGLLQTVEGVDSFEAGRPQQTIEGVYSLEAAPNSVGLGCRGMSEGPCLLKRSRLGQSGVRGGDGAGGRRTGWSERVWEAVCVSCEPIKERMCSVDGRPRPGTSEAGEADGVDGERGGVSVSWLGRRSRSVANQQRSERAQLLVAHGRNEWGG